MSELSITALTIFDRAAAGLHLPPRGLRELDDYASRYSYYPRLESLVTQAVRQARESDAAGCASSLHQAAHVYQPIHVDRKADDYVPPPADL